MADALYTKLREVVRNAGQDHLLAHWETLAPTRQQHLADQIFAIDFPLLTELTRTPNASQMRRPPVAHPSPPPAVPIESAGVADAQRTRATGATALRSGQLGVILVAGGQGSRLGFDHPKGMFPIGPVSNRPLFQVLIDYLLAIRGRYQASIPLFLMTSPATHDETIDFLASHQRFGLPSEDLYVFCQGTMPVVDADSGRVLLDDRDSVCLSPDGHGGVLAALKREGCLAAAADRGIDHLFYAQVDNPLAQICDPWLIGCHLQADSEMTTQVIRKRDPQERVGNVVSIDEQLRIIEYSDLSPDEAGRRNPDGRLTLWAGNMGVHVFQRQFLERMVTSDEGLAFHRALKRTPFLGADGQRVTPPLPNSIKFERFIFDLLPAARNAIVVEGDPVSCFAPVKNADTAATDTPTTAKRLMLDLYATWLAAAGATIAEGTRVEINPRFALDAGELATRIPAGHVFAADSYLGPDQHL